MPKSRFVPFDQRPVTQAQVSYLVSLGCPRAKAEKMSRQQASTEIAWLKRKQLPPVQSAGGKYAHCSTAPTTTPWKLEESLKRH